MRLERMKTNMEILSAVIYLFAVLICRARVAAGDEHCYHFHGNSFLVFSPQNFDNTESAHYEFEFKTNSLNGIIMHARGPYGDGEALYIRGGNLHYNLFNVEPSGIGRQFGGHFVSEERVDNNSWIKVHLYRSKEIRDRVFRSSRMQTGIEFELNGRNRSYVDHLVRRGINISPNIYIGGYSSSLSSTVGNFTGQIRGIKKDEDGRSFENPSLNYKSLVDLTCED